MRLTRPGAAILAILVGCAVVVAVTDGYPRALAALVALLILLALAGEGLASGYAGDMWRKQEVLRGQARPRKLPPAEEPPQPAASLVSRRHRDPG
jgi:hypothetical protein